MIDAALDALHAISLEELDRRAALQQRIDRKYLVPLGRFPDLLGALGADHDALEIDGRRGFAYESVYFDTPSLDAFHDHVNGRRPRMKIRTRLYRDAGLCSFEVKVKQEDDETVKEDLEYDPADHGRLTPAACSLLDDVCRRVLGRPAPDDLAPALRTAFRRSTVVRREGGERLTADRNLRLSRDGRTVVLRGDHVLVETKTGDGDGEADRVLARMGIDEVAFSKYRVGIGLLAARDPNPPLGDRPGFWFHELDAA